MLKAEGRLLFRLEDMAGLCDKAVLLSPEAYFIAASLDGKSEASDIQASFARAFARRLLASSDIDQVVRALDENLFLDTPRFKEHLEKLKQEYARLPRRPAALAGLGYPSEAGELSAALDGFFEPPGPGRTPATTAGELVGLVSPHIDFKRGGAAYAWAYREILSRGLSDLYVVLGVAHAGSGSPFVLSLKDYETPFGPAEVDRDLAQALRLASPVDIAEQEILHRGEHSIEFQAVWLMHLARRLGRPLRILPLLCSSLAEGEPEPSEAALGVLRALEGLLRGYRGRVTLLAGADLAHVGPRFGDAQPASQLMGWVEAEDKRSLERVLAKDSEGFYESVMKDGGKRRVCGLGALYAFTWLLKRLHPKAQGKILRYEHAGDPAGGEVSFASLAFTSPTTPRAAALERGESERRSSPEPNPFPRLALPAKGR